MADGNNIEMDVDGDEGEEGQHRPVFRNLGKCPKSFQKGMDFRAYLAKFRLYCNLNHIQEAQRAPLLFTLLDGEAFDTVTSMQIRNMENFNRVSEQLVQKFENPAGSMGHLFKLNNRKQMFAETLLEYFQALIQLAMKTNLDEQGQRNKVIELIMNNSKDSKTKMKVINFLSTVQELHLDDQEKWTNFKALIHRMAKYSELEKYSDKVTDAEGLDHKIFLLNQQLEKLNSNTCQNHSAHKGENQMVAKQTSKGNPQNEVCNINQNNKGYNSQNTVQQDTQNQP